MGLRRRAGSEVVAQRRTGPADEDHWWIDADQAFVERPLLAPKDWGRGWRTVPMWNNAERLDPYGSDEHSELIRAARSGRRLTALDEGAAWRLRREQVMAVARVEVFDTTDSAAHRAAWRDHSCACLDAVFRERWRERDRVPGWIEARPKPDEAVAPLAVDDGWRAALDQIDWLTVEDHTGSEESASVTSYEHLTIWCGRAIATLTVRHDAALDLDASSAGAAMAAYRRLWQLDR